MKKGLTCLAVLILLASCAKKQSGEVFLKELGCCTWTESSAGNTFEYSFTREFMTVNANGQKFGDFKIAGIDDAKRIFVVYAERSKKYKDIWWEVMDDSTIQLSQLVGGTYYDSLEQALSAERTGKWMPLKKK